MSARDSSDVWFITQNDSRVQQGVRSQTPFIKEKTILEGLIRDLWCGCLGITSTFFLKLLSLLSL